MYNVIEDISSIDRIVLFDYYEQEKDGDVIPLKKLYIDLYGKKYVLPNDKSLSKEWKGIYGNVVITGDGLNGDMIILQDYGVSHNKKDGYYELPLDFLLSNNLSSLMWYDNALWLCDLSYKNHTVLVCDKLCEYPKIDLNKINGKRPYSINLLVAKDYTLQSPLYFNITLNFNEGIDDIMLKALPTYGELINPIALQYTIDNVLEYGNIQNMIQEPTVDFLTRDYLVHKGFSYNAEAKQWSIGNLVIDDNGELAPNETFDCNGTPIFTNSNLDFLLEKHLHIQ